MHHGRVVKRTGDGILIEFRSVVDAVRCAIEVQNGMVERNAGPAAGAPHRVSDRHSSRRRGRGERRRSDGRRRQYRRAARGHRQAGRDLSCPRTPTGRSRGGSISRSPISARPNSRTSPSRSESIRWKSARRAQARAPPPADQAKPRPSDAWPSRSLAAAIAALLLLVAAGGWYVLGDRLTKPAQAAHLSIVVLPFANLSGDPAQDYFADGVTENLTTDLSRIRDSFVIARNTAFTYKGKSIDAKEIGKELGVRYVLEGSVQRDQNRVRVNAQLIDAESGAHLWADRFDEDVADLFKLQDEVVARLARSLELRIGQGRSRKGRSFQKSGRHRSDDARLRLAYCMPEGIPRLRP